MNNIVDAVALMVPGDVTDKRKVAESFVLMAIKKIGRLNGVDFNRLHRTFSLTSGKKTYNLGRDILAADVKIWNLQEFWRTDVQGWPIDIRGLDDFNSVARGGTASGAPVIATVYGPVEQRVLEVYPSPDQAYTVAAIAKLSIEKYEDIPSRYDDVIMSTAVTLLNGIKDPNVALQMVRMGLGEIKADGPVAWTGSTIPSRDNFGRNESFRRGDSGNLR